jgi:hypothetical protein
MRTIATVAGDTLVSPTSRRTGHGRQAVGYIWYRDRRMLTREASPRFARAWNVMCEDGNDGILCIEGDAIEK